MEDRTVIEPQFQAPAGGPEATQILTPGMAPAAPPAYADRTQQAIVTTCPVCGTPNGPAERYCQDCGLLLGSQPAVVEPLPDLSTLARLVDASGREFPLNPGANSLGRDSADILIPDATVSRRHAQITLEEGKVFVEDLGSSNGTSVAGRKIPAGERAAAMNGDTLKVGQIVLTLNLPGGESRPAAPAPAAAPAAAGPAPEPPAERGPAVAALVLPDGTEMGLSEGVNSVGRRSTNHVVISDAFMSGRHADITVNADGTAQMADVGSTNGSYLEGRRLAANTPIPLVDGTVFTLGKTELTYRATAPADAGTPAEAEPAMAADSAFETVRDPEATAPAELA